MLPTWWERGLGARRWPGPKAALAAAGATIARLWVLRDNERARGLYERRGWRATGVTREAPWPPYPVEWEYAVQLPAVAAR
ncbi:MAG: hypothetical protein R2731_16855 [Nocardioides sp.]